MQGRHYHFNGNTEEIVNSILSLLLGKEYYQENSFYSSFLSDSDTERYRKRIRTILELMQKENLILIRQTPVEEIPDLNTLPENGRKGKDTLHAGTDRVYLRQHGREILSAGGYKRNPKNSPILSTVSQSTLPYDTRITIIIILIASALFSI